MAEQKFEESLAELELILRELEDGTTGLDEALARYEKGVQLLRGCYAQLQSAEQKIRQLSGVDENGMPTFKPFDHSSAVESSRGRSGRKSSDEE